MTESVRIFIMGFMENLKQRKKTTRRTRLTTGLFAGKTRETANRPGIRNCNRAVGILVIPIGLWAALLFHSTISTMMLPGENTPKIPEKLSLRQADASGPPESTGNPRSGSSGHSTFAEWTLSIFTMNPLFHANEQVEAASFSNPQEDLLASSLIGSSNSSFNSSSSGSITENQQPGPGTSTAEEAWNRLFADGADFVPLRYETTKTLAYKTIYVDDNSLQLGTSVIKQKGKTGIRTEVFEVLVDTEGNIKGKEKLISSEITATLTDEIIRRGTAEYFINTRRNFTVAAQQFAKIAPYLINNGTRNYKAFKENADGTITVDGRNFAVLSKKARKHTAFDGLEWCTIGHRNASAYPNCITPHVHNTASGLKAVRGVVATYGYRNRSGQTCSNLPIGAVVFVKNYGLAVVADFHGVSSTKTLLDVCYNPGEALQSPYKYINETSDVYVLSLP